MMMWLRASRKRALLVLAGLIALLIVLVVVAIALPGGNDATSAKVTLTATRTLPTPILSPTIFTDPLQAARAQYMPTRLVVPKMGLDASVIGEGATDDGSMATPKCQSAADPICGSVYWWNVGVVPGETGNAVIAGHVNRPDASPASFGNLSAMAVGDSFTIDTAKGVTLSFIVYDVTVVSAYVKGGDNPIINQIFGPSTDANVNLITCIGDWDGATFNERLVVQARLVGPSPLP